MPPLWLGIQLRAPKAAFQTFDPQSRSSASFGAAHPRQKVHLQWANQHYQQDELFLADVDEGSIYEESDTSSASSESSLGDGIDGDEVLRELHALNVEQRCASIFNSMRDELINVDDLADVGTVASPDAHKLAERLKYKVDRLEVLVMMT
ncbi:hypothetical protein B0H19DRAFT_1072685 [Mycena capillaripes]|nr:hypothetical protein B0H19DRAFT_1072685 [Mycena capillaripes]